MARHLILTLEAPLMSFGGETVDNLGVIRPFPAVSMLTGLLANALGWRRIERQRHQDLQDGGLSLQDFQTAQLGASDRGWTTRGAPEDRAGGANTYNAPHLRYRDYHADMRVTVALRLEPSDDAPTLDDLEAALEEPARPLFIGRKPCLPSSPLFSDYCKGETALDALLAWPLDTAEIRQPATVRLLWPEGENAPDMKHVRTNRRSLLTDERNWVSGLHGGGRPVCEGTAPPERFGTTGPDEEGQS